MKALLRPRVKICCISSIEEAWIAIKHGAAALGLVSEMPSGPGVISAERIAEIAAALPPAIGSFLLTCKQDVESIIDQQRRLRVNTVQICDRLESGSHIDLRRALPGISIVQVIHVRGPESVAEARSVGPHVDGILLDSGNQSLVVKEEPECANSRGSKRASIPGWWSERDECCGRDQSSRAFCSGCLQRCENRWKTG